MSHEQMLAWLDQANGGVVQAAADRLVAAATEIRKIADELKVRPQWVRWKGEGANAFRTWSGQLANTTHRLGDFSEDSAKWLARASEAIATAQASIPRDKAGAEGNLKAAQSAPNDPDARAVGAKSADELARIAEGKEKVRQEAAAEMRKLGQAYQLSAQQLEGLERPRFRPLPGDMVPIASDRGRSDTPAGAPPHGGAPAGSSAPPGGAAIPSPSGTDQPRVEGGGPGGGGTGPDTSDQVQRPPPPSAPDHVAVEPVGLELDGAGQPLPQAPPANPQGPPSGVRPDGGTAQPVGTIPPTLGRGPRPPGSPPNLPGSGRTESSRRSSTPPNAGRTGPAPGRAPGGGPLPPSVPPNPTGPTRPVIGTPSPASGNPAAGRAPGRDGIVGGRPVPSAPGGPSGGLPRGTVMGGPTAGTGTGGSGAGRGAATPGQRPMGAYNGVVGGQPRRQGRARGAQAPTQGGAAPRASRPSGSQGDDERRDRPDYLTEDQDTWRQDGRRVVPPVID
ncbi:translation initiation factor IF-2 [Streptomyces lasiicapitis]|uniref:translation initiation factor IF-2 n=1 Tax=Streptomyces lasiicapitis TaxID=1923961 RepID=UPI0036CE6806